MVRELAIVIGPSTFERFVMVEEPAMDIKHVMPRTIVMLESLASRKLLLPNSGDKKLFTTTHQKVLQ